MGANIRLAREGAAVRGTRASLSPGGSMLKRALAAVAVFACAAAPLVAQAPQSAGGNQMTITGQVIDLNCHTTQGASGPGHKQCAQACAKAGVALAILGTDGNVYVPVSAKAGDPQNSKLVPFAEDK